MENVITEVPETDAATGRDGLGTQHQLWLTMQSAHNRYRSASTALDALTALSPTGADSYSSERTLQIDAAASEQRTAFETYIESRLQLSEYVLSKQSPQPPAVGTEEAEEEPGGGLKVRGRIMLAMVAAFLFPTAFGLGYLIHERNQTRDLATARDTAAEELKDARSQVEKLSRRIEQLRAANQAAIRSAVKAAAQAHKRRPPGAQRVALKAAVSPGRIARNHQEVVQLEKRGERTYREFTLTPLKSSERIGPVGLTVVKVDPQRRFFDLTITADNVAPQKKRVNLNEPVWIDLRGHPKAVELVVNRIDGERVQGYVSEPRNQRMSWRRVDDRSTSGRSTD